LPALIINGAGQGKSIFLKSHTVHLYYRHDTSNHAACEGLDF